MIKHTFVGFGFGPIQSGLFVSEAFKSGNFNRIVISEIDQKLVDAVRNDDGSYHVNVAHKDGIKAERINGIEIYNPSVEADRSKLLQALSEATEIVTSLPSVDFYDKGQSSVSSLIRGGLQNSTAEATIIYTAENNNHAAEILEGKIGSFENVQYLNTVIGKMSQVVIKREEIEKQQLKAIAAGIDRAFLVEQFNRILVTKCNIPGFKPGIEVFIEREDLLPFEEAKLYGHNAIHALLAYLGVQKGYLVMSELSNDAAVMKIARKAFLEESGAALIKKYSNLNDELFTKSGYENYAEDLLERMTNPYLSDAVERAARDPIRKLGYNDRIFGTMRLALEYGIEPVNMAKAAGAGLGYLLKNARINNVPENLRNNKDVGPLLAWLWNGQTGEYSDELVQCVREALFFDIKTLP